MPRACQRAASARESSVQDGRLPRSGACLSSVRRKRPTPEPRRSGAARMRNAAARCPGRGPPRPAAARARGRPGSRHTIAIAATYRARGEISIARCATARCRTPARPGRPTRAQGIRRQIRRRRAGRPLGLPRPHHFTARGEGWRSRRRRRWPGRATAQGLVRRLAWHSSKSMTQPWERAAGAAPRAILSPSSRPPPGGHDWLHRGRYERGRLPRGPRGHCGCPPRRRGVPTRASSAGGAGLPLGGDRWPLCRSRSLWGRADAGPVPYAAAGPAPSSGPRYPEPPLSAPAGCACTPPAPAERCYFFSEFTLWLLERCRRPRQRESAGGHR